MLTISLYRAKHENPHVMIIDYLKERLSNNLMAFNDGFKIFYSCKVNDICTFLLDVKGSWPAEKIVAECKEDIRILITRRINGNDLRQALKYSLQEYNKALLLRIDILNEIRKKYNS